MLLPEWKITLGGVDVSDLLENIRTSRKITDYPRIGETKTGTCSITLKDADGNFSPSKSSNWWTDNSQPQSGITTPVVVSIKTTTVFTGVVKSVDIVDRTAVVTCYDKQEDLRKQEITNFGIDRDFRLAIDPTGQNLDHDPIRYYRRPTAAGFSFTTHPYRISSGVLDHVHLEPIKFGGNGVYPFHQGLAPFSEGSVTIEKSDGNNVTIVDEVRDRGILSSDNVQITDEAAISEGEPIDATSPYPRLQGKSAYRWIEVDDAVRKLLQHTGASGSRIQVAPKTTALHPIIIGRPGYDNVLGNIGESQYPTWTGYITDMLVDGHFLYFLLSVNRDRPYFSRILRYDKRDNSWEDYFTSSVAKRQYINLAKLGNHLIIGATDARNKSSTNLTPAIGSYDSAVSQNEHKRTLIVSIDTTQTSLTESVLVAKNADFPFQIGQYRQFGSANTLSTSDVEFLNQNVVADTQRKLIVSGTNLYYFYARVLANGIEAGVAKTSIGGTTTQKFHHVCANNNHLTGSLVADGTKVYYSNTFLKHLSSEWRIVEGNL